MQVTEDVIAKHLVPKMVIHPDDYGTMRTGQGLSLADFPLDGGLPQLYQPAGVCSFFRISSFGARRSEHAEFDTPEAFAKNLVGQWVGYNSARNADRVVDSAGLAIVTSSQPGWKFFETNTKLLEEHGWQVFKVKKYRKYVHSIAYWLVSADDFSKFLSKFGNGIEITDDDLSKAKGVFREAQKLAKERLKSTP